MPNCHCDEQERLIYSMLNAAPLLAGDDERLRWRMLNLAESLAGLVSVQRLFHGCRPLFPYPGRWEHHSRCFRLIRDLGDDSLAIREMIKGAEAHDALDRLRCTTDAFCELERPGEEHEKFDLHRFLYCLDFAGLGVI